MGFVFTKSDSSFGLSGGISELGVGKESAGLGYGLSGGDSEISALDLGEGYGIGEKSSGLGYGHGGGGGGGGHGKCSVFEFDNLEIFLNLYR